MVSSNAEPSRSTLTPQQQEEQIALVLENISALMEYTRMTGTKTDRTQREWLFTLSREGQTEVAKRLVAMSKQKDTTVGLTDEGQRLCQIAKRSGFFSKGDE